MIKSCFTKTHFYQEKDKCSLSVTTYNFALARPTHKKSLCFYNDDEHVNQNIRFVEYLVNTYMKLSTCQRLRIPYH